MLFLVCSTQVLISVSACLISLFFGNAPIARAICFGLLVVVSIVCAVATYGFFSRIRESYYKSSVARALLSTLAEIEDVIILDQDLRVLYIKYPNNNSRFFDFESFFKNNFEDPDIFQTAGNGDGGGADCDGFSQYNIKRCCSAVRNGTFFECVLQTIKTTQTGRKNAVLLKIIPLYVNPFVPFRAIIISEITKVLGRPLSPKEAPLAKHDTTSECDTISAKHCATPAKCDTIVAKHAPSEVSAAKHELQNFPQQNSQQEATNLQIFREIIQLMLQLVDVTEQRKVEHQFTQAQKLQAIGQLAGGIAHDFNNLLTAIIGVCDLLLQRIMPDNASYPDIMQIKQNANRASQLVKQLLAFSRQQSLQPRTINIKNTLSEILSLLRRLIGSRISLKVINGQDLWLVKVDAVQLEQVIINVVVNAKDAISGTGTITIETSNYTSQTFGNDVLASGDYVLLKITDTGCGIPKELIPSLFDPFFSTKEIGKGTGLGLSTVYGIIKQTGGAIEVESEVGKGTVFKIFLTRSFDEDCALEGKPPPITDITGDETIMIVEDESAVRIFAARALKDKGYKVVETANGEEALAIIEGGRTPDVIVTDISMPVMDGVALQKALQQKQLQIPIIFTSGYTEENFRQDLSNNQFIHFLPKPFTTRELASKIREVLT
ncbi:MAG: response regulator [Holosporales bacterium]|jgi:signal transduction histidine kinase|nr:response regulator [Holosporales bacterium]